MIILNTLDKILAEITIILIKIYQYTLSPDKWLPSLRLKWKVCAHHPHCSQYSINTIRRYWFISWLPKMTERVFSCSPSKEKIYDPEYYKVVFFSWAPIAVPFLHELHKDKKFDIVWVVTMPDAPSGRWMEVKPNIIKTETEKLFDKNKESIDIIPYNNSYKKQISTLYDNCFNNKTFGKNYTFDYCYSKIEKWSHDKSFIWKVLLVNSHFAWYYQGFNSDDMIEYFQEAFNMQEFNKIIQSDKKVTLNKVFRLDDIMIDKKYRNKWYFNKLLLNLYQELKFKNINYLAIYTAPKKELLKKYFKRGFKQIWELKEKNTWSKYVILIKDLSTISIEEQFIQTPESLRLDSKKYAKEANNFKLRLEAKQPDYLVVIAYWKIIPQYILDIAKIAPINVHGSLLPKYRGASPLQSVFLNQEKQTGITIMKMDANMDTGNMIDMLKFDIKFDWTVKDLIDKIMQKWPKFLNKTLLNYGKRLLGEVKQNDEKATYCQKIEKEDGEINPYKDSIQEIYNKYRGYYMRPKIFFNLSPFAKGERFHPNVWEWNQGDLINWKRVIIEHLKLDQKLFESEKDKPLFVWNELNRCVLEISLKPEWKKTMDRESFKSGYVK